MGVENSDGARDTVDGLVRHRVRRKPAVGERLVPQRDRNADVEQPQRQRASRSPVAVEQARHLRAVLPEFGGKPCV